MENLRLFEKAKAIFLLIQKRLVLAGINVFEMTDDGLITVGRAEDVITPTELTWFLDRGESGEDPISGVTLILHEENEDLEFRLTYFPEDDSWEFQGDIMALDFCNELHARLAQLLAYPTEEIQFVNEKTAFTCVTALGLAHADPFDDASDAPRSMVLN
jgi:hypothetical protein